MKLLRYSILFIAFLLSGCLSPLGESSEGEARATVQRLEVVARYNHQNGLPPGQIESLAVGPQGQIYVRIRGTGTASSVTLLRRDENGNPYFHSLSVPNGQTSFSPVVAAPNGRILAATNSGITIIENHNNQLTSSQSISYSTNVVGLGFDSQGRLYAGRLSGGAAVYDQGLPQNQATANPDRILGEGERYSLFTQGNNGRLYAVGTSGRSIAVIDQGIQVTTQQTLYSSDAGSILSMAFDSANSRLIVGAYDDRLYILNEDASQVLASYSTAQGLASNNISAVGVSSNGSMILVGFEGNTPAQRGLQVIMNGQVRERYSLSQLGLNDSSFISITAITYNPIDGSFYVGTSSGDLIVLRPNMLASGECAGAISRHPLVGRLVTQEHSSLLTGSVILPEPPDLSRPFTLKLPASRTKTEYYKEWYDYIFDVLRTFTGAHGYGSFSGVHHRELRDTSHQTCSADQSEMRQQFLDAWKSYREEQYMITFQPYVSRQSDDQTSLPRLGGTSALFGQVHEEMPGFVSVTRNSDATTIVVQATSVSKAVKNITLQASWYDGTTTKSLSDKQASSGSQQLRLKVLDHPADDYYWGMLMICLEETQDSTMGYELLIPFIAGRPPYQNATVHDVEICPSQFPGYNTAVWPAFEYSAKGNNTYTAYATLYAGQYYVYGGVFDFGPDYLRGSLRYKIRNVVDGTMRWSPGFDVDEWRFGGYGRARYTKTSALPAVELDCEEQIMGLHVMSTEGYFFLGPTRAMNSPRGYYIALDW